MAKRVDMIMDGKFIPPLCVFPEGTTSNNKHILSFKKGCFEYNVPLKVACLKYEVRNFNMALDVLDMPSATLMGMC